ncbi:TonB-dependent receptor [Rhabdobacter roseus]|uniref:TonB-linked SusC/RagA family outer membrane protein n=1 Tax=Rhabdobacter roseus TaxID=1655419 RepID=A0A840TXU1_9BACT|nr:TonB-dependent receptor [Rhabdobacter roseus]MBB5286422.1 TonB-linked SusC/RagA family outer membrane protein [Rhabdobacter roseus]
MKKRIPLILFLAPLLGGHGFQELHAQTILAYQPPQVENRAVQESANSLINLLKKLETIHKVSFVYQRELLENKTISTSINENDKPEAILARVLPPMNLRYKKLKGGGYAILARKATTPGTSAESKPASTTTTQVPRENVPAGTSGETALVSPLPPSLAPSQPVEITVQGRVVDAENGEGLPGVSITLKGTTRGTNTDVSGNYSLSVPDEQAVLVFSFVGYQAREEVVGTRTTLNVTLRTDSRALEEVVVVGYGTVRKSDLTGSVAQVKSREINAFPAANPLQALSGRAAGVQVTQNSGAPGAPVSVRIRGTNSVQGSNEPLYVVDGFPIAGSNPTILNNADIESVEVLKDASATAIYGSRGANGVVIITTRQGKAGITRVDFETSYSVQTLRKRMDLMNAQEYARFYNIQAANDNLSPYFTQQQIDGFGEGFDWQDLVFRRAPMKTTSLNVNGGNEKTQFSVSGSFFGQDGIIVGSDYNRYSLRTNINHKMGEKFSVNLSSTLSRLNTDRRDNAGGSRGNSMISAALSAPPTLTPFNEDGSYRVLATAYPFVATDLINPINFINEQTNQIRANRILTNAALLFNPIPELTIKISGGIENADDRTDEYTTRNYFNSPGRASISTSQVMSLLNENTISYQKTFQETHSISAVAGFTYQDFTTTFLSATGNGFLSDITETANLGSATTPGIPSSGYSKAVLLSYLARVNYGYQDKYLLTASLRRDGSSRYSEGNKWGLFPSAAVAWRVSNEEFLRNSTLISELKFRASWGLTGSQAISPYSTLNQLSAGRTVFNDALFTTFAPGTTLPGNLKWETTEQIDVGIDLGIFRNRVLFTADYYIKNTRDLLNTVRLPSSLGFTTTIQNVGAVQNKGLELGLDGRIFTGAFEWDLNANISFNRNKVVTLYGGDDILGGTVNVVVVNDVANILREGQPIGRFWGYQEDGYTDQGRIRFRDLDGDGAITQNDKTYIGDPNPNFIYGINSRMSFKNFDLTLFIQGTQGNDIFNVSSITNTIDYGFGLNMPREVLYNHWSPSNPDAKYPLISRNTATRLSDRFVEDGSYLRLRNIQLAYNLPTEKLGINWLRSLQVYASGQNLLTFTKYSWWDPEVNSRGGANSTVQGIDHNSYPTAKAVTAGLRVGF